MDFTVYYQAVRELRESLTQRFGADSIVVSVANIAQNSIAGGVAEVTCGNAARVIVDGTHRLATDEEARAFTIRRSADTARHAPDSVSRVQALFDEAMKSV